MLAHTQGGGGAEEEEKEQEEKEEEGINAKMERGGWEGTPERRASVMWEGMQRRVKVWQRANEGKAAVATLGAGGGGNGKGQVSNTCYARTANILTFSSS